MSERPTLMRLERDAEIATILFDNPTKLNAWSWESARQLGEIADEVRFDDSIRVVIVRATGRAFCAGVDLGMPEDRITGRSPAEKVRNYYEKFRWVHERFKVFSNLPQPVVMAVHGFCLGAGLEIAMMGDIRVAADDAITDFGARGGMEDVFRGIPGSGPVPDRVFPAEAFGIEYLEPREGGRFIEVGQPPALGFGQLVYVVDFQGQVGRGQGLAGLAL